MKGTKIMTHTQSNLQIQLEKLEQHMFDLRAKYLKVRTCGINRAFFMFSAMQTEEKIRNINAILGLTSKEVYAEWSYD